jgi:hypothetical protein
MARRLEGRFLSHAKMEIRFKKLPPRWHYLISRRQIVEAVADVGEWVRVIEFIGPGHKGSELTAGLYSAGQCDAHMVAVGWCFRLQFCGLSENVLSMAGDELTPKALDGVREFLSEPGNASVSHRGRRRTLFLRIENGILVPSFKTETLDGFWEGLELSAPWW